jgi:hypothetical protein
MFLIAKSQQLKLPCAVIYFGVLLLRSSKNQPFGKKPGPSLTAAKCSILGFELGRPVRQSMEDVTVGEPKVMNAPQDFDQNILRTCLIIDQNVRQQRVALFDIMATCGYLL